MILLYLTYAKAVGVIMHPGLTAVCCVAVVVHVVVSPWTATHVQ